MLQRASSDGLSSFDGAQMGMVGYNDKAREIELFRATV